MRARASGAAFVLMCGEHPQGRGRGSQELRDLFDQAVDVMLYIDVAQEPSEGGDKRRCITELSFRPTPGAA